MTIENCPPASASCRQMLGAQVTGNYCTVQSLYSAFTQLYRHTGRILVSLAVVAVVVESRIFGVGL